MDECGDTALSCALQIDAQSNIDLLKTSTSLKFPTTLNKFLDLGASLTIKSPRARSVLCAATSNPSLKWVQRLVAAGMDINTKDDLGRTLLHVAAEPGEVSMFQWLIGNGTDRNMRDHSGERSLQYAIGSGRVGNYTILSEIPNDFDGRSDNKGLNEMYGSLALSSIRYLQDIIPLLPSGVGKPGKYRKSHAPPAR